MIIILENHRPKSWNEFWSGKHWSKRNEWGHVIHALVRGNLSPDSVIFDKPVSITVMAYFDKHPQDSSNICTKPYIDALIGWLITDDSPKYVPSVTSESYVDKLNPRVVIEVKEIHNE